MNDTPQRQSWLENRIPPPLLVVLTGAAMWAIARVSPVLAIDGVWRILFGALLAALGIAALVSGAMEFRRAKTTISPVNPEQASSLVSGGIYRYTRNPMYVGFTAMLLGWGVTLAAPLAFLGVLAFALYVTRFQITPEERVLKSIFGREYEDYCQRVRRWL